jgi:hypothetical protein
VNIHAQNDKEAIPEASAVYLSNSVIDQQNNVDAKSSEERELNTYFPKL